jgi:hypothetical protein
MKLEDINETSLAQLDPEVANTLIHAYENIHILDKINVFATSIAIAIILGMTVKYWLDDR